MELWLPVSFTLILILPANSPQQRWFCDGAHVGIHCKHPLIIGIIIGQEFCFFFFVPSSIPDLSCLVGVQTWESRIEISALISRMKMTTKLRKQIAIASGKLYGLGPGKSVQKNFYHSRHPIICYYCWRIWTYRWIWCLFYIYYCYFDLLLPHIKPIRYSEN
jgi:cell division protein FtsW